MIHGIAGAGGVNEKTHPENSAGFLSHAMQKLKRVTYSPFALHQPDMQVQIEQEIWLFHESFLKHPPLHRYRANIAKGWTPINQPGILNERGPQVPQSYVCTYFFYILKLHSWCAIEGSWHLVLRLLYFPIYI